MTRDGEQALAAAGAELEQNYQSARQLVFSSLWVDGNAFDSAKWALSLTESSLRVLRGELLDAARGLRPWPLDGGTQINEAGALDAWQRLAGSVRETLAGIKGYLGKWSALNFLATVSRDVAKSITPSGSSMLVIALVALAVIALKVVR